MDGIGLVGLGLGLGLSKTVHLFEDKAPASASFLEDLDNPGLPFPLIAPEGTAAGFLLGWKSDVALLDRDREGCVVELFFPNDRSAVKSLLLC
jgi:hypothetical protein